MITLQAVGSRGEDTDHLHLIVVKISGDEAEFNIDGLLQTLDGTSMEVLRPELQSKYAPWTYTLPESAYWKINSIYQNLSRFAAQTDPVVAPRPLRPQAGPAAEGRAASQSRTQSSRSHAHLTAPARAERRKRNAEDPFESESNKKRKKGSAGAGSSGLALTHVDRRLGRKDDPILDFKKFAKAHDEF